MAFLFSTADGAVNAYTKREEFKDKLCIEPSWKKCPDQLREGVLNGFFTGLENLAKEEEVGLRLLYA